MAPDVLRRGISVTLETKLGAMEGQIFIRHLTDRGLVAHEALELCSDVCGAVFVPVEENLVCLNSGMTLVPDLAGGHTSL